MTAAPRKACAVFFAVGLSLSRNPRIQQDLKKIRNVFIPARETGDTSAKSESKCPASVPKGFRDLPKNTPKLEQRAERE
jgi:hypothetical protein